jgi:hypothetical protein
MDLPSPSPLSSNDAPALPDRDLPCPLCDYNLRGIAEPRCPECGHTFDFADLLGGHIPPRWLYEHRRGWAPGALMLTWMRSLRPRAFWSSVRPTLAIHRARLIAYVLQLIALAAILSWLPLFSYGIVREMGHQRTARQQLLATMLDETGQLRPEMGERAAMRAGETVDEFIDRFLPSPWLSALWYAGSTWRPMQRLLMGILAWAVLSVVMLVSFRKAFGKPDVNIWHLWRVAIYSGDFLLVGWAFLLAPGHYVQPAMDAMDAIFPPLFDIAGGRRAGAGAALLLLLLLVVAALRFASGYRRYLGWPNALRTTLLIQCFVLLAVMQLMIFVNANR